MSITLKWSDLLCPVECGRSDAVPVRSLTFSRLLEQGTHIADGIVTQPTVNPDAPDLQQKLP